MDQYVLCTQIEVTGRERNVGLVGDTGIPEIDVVSDESQYNLPLTLGTGSGTYLYKEIAYQSPDGTLANATTQAIVSSWTSTTKTLNVTNIAGLFLSNNTVYGASSNAHYTLVTYDPIENAHAYVAYDNKVIQNEANNVIDISEINPFGDIGTF